MAIYGILLAGGSSERFGTDKLLAQLGSATVLEQSLKKMLHGDYFDQIVITTSQVNQKEVQQIANHYSPKIKVALGGSTRFKGTQNAVAQLRPEPDDLLIFHNAANPQVTVREIAEVILQTQRKGAAGVGSKALETIRQISATTSKTLDRNKLFLMQTPQGLLSKIYDQGSQIAIAKNLEITDDLMLAELAGIKPKIINASCNNFKLTYPADFERLARCQRVGLGEDSHPFGRDPQKPCILAGVKIKDNPGLKGNSDGDVALHAIANAILSLTGSGSLSRFSDQLCAQGITDSVVYLQEALAILKSHGGRLLSLSLAFEAQRPKLEKHFDKMQARLKKLTGLAKEQIGLTATSGEGLTSFGRGEGVKVLAIGLAEFFVDY
jgi:2-C-methyl-D-erythritol 2,4-cyclodiphosphate synthase/2-C-methyl-D-erythritol 4-phosphate cytidylyltransferase